MGFSSLSQYYIYYFLQSQTCFLRGIIREWMVWIDLLCVKYLSWTWRPSRWVVDSHRVNLTSCETLVHFIKVVHVENREMGQKCIFCFLQLYMLSELNHQDSKWKVYLLRRWTAIYVQYGSISWKLLQSKCSNVLVREKKSAGTPDGWNSGHSNGNIGEVPYARKWGYATD